jgi:hypothetical protein
MSAVIRISVIRCDSSQFEHFRAIMVESEALLRPGIEALPGFVSYFVGEDATNSAFSNVSIWRTLKDAQQMEHFTPMLELAKRVAAAGARFDRPITNHAVLWTFGDVGFSLSRDDGL